MNLWTERSGVTDLLGLILLGSCINFRHSSSAYLRSGCHSSRLNKVFQMPLTTMGKLNKQRCESQAGARGKIGGFI